MKQYDIYGIGNALVDTEYKADDAFLDHAKLTKGIMTLCQTHQRHHDPNRRRRQEKINSASRT